MAVATETATTTAGSGGGGVTHEVAGGEAPPLSWRRLHNDGDSGNDNGGGDCDCGGDNHGDSGR
jgi:hypothetical protein